MTRFIARFLRNDSGATAIEYGLICALLFLGIVTAVATLGDANTGGFAKTVAKLSAAMNAAVGG